MHKTKKKPNIVVYVKDIILSGAVETCTKKTTGLLAEVSHESERNEDPFSFFFFRKTTNQHFEVGLVS